MANWIELENTRVTFACPAAPLVNKKIETYIEYDKDRTTPTQTYIRFRGHSLNGNEGNWVDIFLVFYNPNNNPNEIGRALYTIKKHGSNGGRWDIAECSGIKITKEALDETFYIQDYWICNNGQGYTASHWTNNISGAYTYFSGDRKNYVQTGLGSKSFSIEPELTIATKIRPGSTKITDNGNNTFTIKATKGRDGTNNPVLSLDTLKWGYDENYLKTYENGASYTLEIINTAEDERTVYAKSRTTATYGSNFVVSTEARIKQYVPPEHPDKKPELHYNKSRLTIKENWKFTWTAATKANDTSPVAGYRVAIKQNGTSIPIYDSTGKCITTYSKGNNWNSFDTDSTTLTINPQLCGFKPGDTVQIGVKPYTLYGTGDKLFKPDYLYSTTATVQNAGIVRVKTAEGWKEGQVYVKTSNGWKEAETVYTKTADGWKESQ